MAEYLVQEESLTAIADAIRAKTGTTAELSLTGMVEAIEGISSKKIVTGTYNTSSDNSTVSITHGLNTTPNFTILYQTSTYASTNSRYRVIVHAKRNNDSSMNSMQVYTPNTGMITEDKSTVTMEEETVTFDRGTYSGSSSHAMYNGKYGYLIGVI